MKIFLNVYIIKIVPFAIEESMIFDFRNNRTFPICCWIYV